MPVSKIILGYKLKLYRNFDGKKFVNTMTDEELKEIIKKVIDENEITSMKDIGKLMKNVMPLIKGKADGKQVNVIAKELLN